MFFILFLIFIFWIITIFKYAGFWAYLWQIKEYRLDRMKVHFDLASSRKLLFNKRGLWLLSLLFLSFLPFSFAPTTSGLSALFFYGFFSAKTVKQSKEKSLKLPKYTFRIGLIFLLILSFYGIGAFAAFLYLNKFLLSYFILSDLLAPIFISLAVLFTHPVAKTLKNRLIKKAARKREQLKNLLVIGITGSYAKSSVKELIASILSEQFKVLKTPENINIDIGIAKLILKALKPEHEVFVVEMGAYKKGEINKIAQVVKPQIGVLTGVNDQHIALFGNIQNTQQAKYELIESIPEKGLAIFNGDNKYIKALFRQCNKPKRLYSLHNQHEETYQPILVESIKETADGIKLNIKEEEKEETLTINMPGKHNALNVLGAITVARELDVTYNQIKAALIKFKQLPHAMQFKKGIKDTVIIDDSYTANLDGVLSALETLKSTPGGQKICILQPLVELGASSDRIHKKIGARIAEVCDWCIVTSSDYFSILYKEALENGMGKDAIICLPNAHNALRKAQEICDRGDVILLENRISNIVVDGLILNVVS